MFTGFKVDCEYNGHAMDETGKKRIFVLKDKLAKKGLLLKRELNDNPLSTLEDELVTRAVFPDIIIHNRRNDIDNKCIIEVKKHPINVPLHYDYIKLKAYTSNGFGNNLCYQIGIFILFGTKRKSRKILYESL